MKNSSQPSQVGQLTFPPAPPHSTFDTSKGPEKGMADCSDSVESWSVKGMENHGPVRTYVTANVASVYFWVIPTIPF